MVQTNRTPLNTPPNKPHTPDDLMTGGANVTDRHLYWMLGRFLAPYWVQLIAVFVMLGVVTGLTLLMPYTVQLAVDGPIADGDLTGLIPYGVGYLALIVGIFVVRFAHTYLLQTVGQNALLTLRQQLFEHILKQDMRFFNNTPVGQIVARMSNDIEALTELMSTSFVVVASNMVTMFGIVIVMLLINWRLALLTLAVVPIMLLITVFFRVRIRGASSEYHKVVGEYLAYLNEQIGGMLIVQLFGRQAVSREGFRVINANMREVHTKMRDYYTWYAGLLQILITVALALMLYGGGTGVLAGWATVGMLIAFIDYARRTFEPLMQLAEQFAQIQTALSAGERIARMLRVQPEIVEPPQPSQPEWVQHSLQLEHVNFGYEPRHLVLRDLSLHIPGGQRVAIVGATGAGKTSLAGLLARFYDVNEGSVLIDGVDVRAMSLNELRKQVTVVPQNPYCFNGTIADNIRLFDDSITDEEMHSAAQIACADQFIERLPDAYDYRLMPGGANLSQGQRQLLALARALLHNPDSILILDEATSSIDTETEALIQAGLHRVMEQRTSLVIAHRLSTIREVDRILVMQRGRIVEDGTHEQLLERNGLYAQLYRRQFTDEVEQPTI